MKYIIIPLVGLLLGIAGFVVAPVVMLGAVFLIRWDANVTNGSYGQDPTIRGDLPTWLRWFQTPDERFPGGLYEPAISRMLQQRGRLFTSYIWAGWRNQMMGLAAAVGKETTDYIPDSPYGFWQRGDIWRYTLVLGPILIIAGWQVYRRLDGSFLAVPVLTAKRK